MATMQQLLVWLKDLSTRRGKDGNDWFNPCRASMKLPPIPKESEESRYPDVSRYFTDSPAHIYEEIAPKDESRKVAKPVDQTSDKPLGKDTSRDHDVDIDNLAFDQAKTFGSYLVVPLKDRLGGAVTITGHSRGAPADSRLSVAASLPAGRPAQPGTADCLDDSCCSRKTSSSDSGVSEEASADGAGGEHMHVHCTRCCRPHGMYDGVTYTHYDEDDDVTARNPPPLRSGNTATSTRPNFPYQPRHAAETTPNYRHDHVTDESTDSYNEFDFRRGGPVSCAIAASPRTRRCQPDMTSAESDGGSSVYPASLSDGDRGVVTSGGRCGNNSSDSSNDTYSEYDVRSDDSALTGDDSLFRQPSDYDYFLSRVRHNLKLEAEVQRHIRLSESSDYETNSSAVSGDGYDTSDDIVSLTSITSLSGISLTDERESRRACAPPHADKSRRRSHAAKTEAPPRGRTCAASDAQKQRKTKTVSFADTKKSRRTKPVEYYRLPDFPHKAVPASADETDDVDMTEKLSCRATNFHPTTSKPEVRKAHDRSETAHNRQAAHAKQPSNSQNRLLTDLMRMNHDRQLLVLF